MNAGLLRHRITFIKNQETKKNGRPVVEDVTIKSVWAMVKTMKGTEEFEAAATYSTLNIKFVIRYTSGLDSDMKVKFKNRTYDIVSLTNDDELNKTITIIAKEVV